MATLLPLFFRPSLASFAMSIRSWKERHLLILNSWLGKDGRWKAWYPAPREAAEASAVPLVRFSPESVAFNVWGFHGRLSQAMIQLPGRCTCTGSWTR